MRDSLSLVHIGEPYGTASEHLADRFRHLELSLDRLERARAGDRLGRDELDAQLEALAAAIDSREQASAGSELPLLRLRESLGLSRAAEEVLVALAASELEPRLLVRLVRHWADGRFGDVAFFRELAWRDPAERSLLHELSATGLLARHGLIHLEADRAWGAATPPLFRRVRLGARVALHLLGEQTPAPAAVTLRARGRSLEQLVISRDTVEEMRAALRSAAGRVVCLVGPRQVGKKSLAQAVLQRPLIILDCARLAPTAAELTAALRDALCTAVLEDGALYLDGLDALGGEARLPLRQVLSAELASLAVPVCAGLEGAGESLRDALPELARVMVPMPDSFQQIRLWSLLLPGDVQLPSGQGVEWLTARYSLPAGAIQRCADELARAADRRGQTRVAHDEVVGTVRRQLGSRFGDLAELVINTLSWNDLVLPPETLQRVLEVVMYFRHRERLLRDWGFDAKLPYGRSLSVLLSGEPGTGKTMVAGLLAKEMGLELFRVNLSKVVDKYIGETEKNLGRIFDEARRGQVALLFDEADSLFGKRTEVRNSTDRYSNLAINFLLQSVESHDGVILLTTNHDKAMDPAFKRRIRFRVNFPFPTPEERAALWKSMVPAQARAAEGIRWQELAREFDLAGGSIKNAVVRAALHAVERNQPLTEELLRHTGRLESEEMGRLVNTRASRAAELSDTGEPAP